jgi:adenosylcobinamide-phosphate synthase
LSVVPAPVAVLAIALALDLVLGDPPNRWHPVAWLGTLIAAGRRRLARGSVVWLLAAGAGLTVFVAVVAALAGALVARLASHAGAAGPLIEGAALSLCLSVRGLWRAAGEVARLLEGGDLGGARAALAFHLVSRDTSGLDAGEVAAATVESVAENLTDSILAPALMYLAFGLPGAALYRAVNTADAMLGYREGVLEHFGKLAARADDLLNLVPARLAALSIVAAAALASAAPAGAARVMRRDRRRTASPNAGWTMSAMAGALGVRLVKRQAYALGDGPLPAPHDIRASRALMATAAALAMLAACALLTVATA